jgi:transposase
VHSTSTDRFSLITVHTKRARGVDPHGVLPDYGGIIVHDAWRPYDCYTVATHAMCNAHLLRELQVIDRRAAGPGGRRTGIRA